jgi:hypothetical protein
MRQFYDLHRLSMSKIYRSEIMRVYFLSFQSIIFSLGTSPKFSNVFCAQMTVCFMVAVPSVCGLRPRSYRLPRPLNKEEFCSAVQS